MDSQLLTDVDNWLDTQPKKEYHYLWTKDASMSWTGKTKMAK